MGAGGVIFAENLIKTILLNEKLRQCHVALTDINAKRQVNAVKMTAIISEQLGMGSTPTCTRQSAGPFLSLRSSASAN